MKNRIQFEESNQHSSLSPSSKVYHGCSLVWKCGYCFPLPSRKIHSLLLRLGFCAYFFTQPLRFESKAKMTQNWLEPVCCKKWQKIVPVQLLVWGVGAHFFLQIKLFSFCTKIAPQRQKLQNTIKIEEKRLKKPLFS